MSDLEKCFARPKVRFSKSAESPDQMSDFGVFGKPKITSVTSLKPQIKILKAPLMNNEFGWNSSPEEISTRRSAGDSLDDDRFRLSKTKFVSSTDLEEILPYRENCTNVNKVPSDSGSLQKNSTGTNQPSKPLKSILVEKKSSIAKTVRSSLKNSQKSISSLPEKVSKSSNDEKKTGSNLSQSKSCGRDKENIPSKESSKNVIIKVPHNTPRTVSSASTAERTITQNTRSYANEKSSRASIANKPVQSATKTITEVKKTSKSLTKVEGKIGEKAPAKKSTSTQKPSTVALMACMKSGKNRNKKAPMKKTIVRDTLANCSKVYVGPGLPRSRTPDLLSHSKGENNCRSRSEIHSADKLARPEYNSIACTMRQLQEARKEKIVPDIEHLPAFYRRLINGKVSSALDFGANEAIYRDLIDLSIDEKQLPMRLTRSKDPEPRQRDITPKLSDFFVPTNDDEFRRAVLVRPPSPRVIDTWNPYKISDRIFSWKESLDREF